MVNEIFEEWNFCILDKSFQKDSFDCGVPQLNDYLKKYARQNQEMGVAKTYVATLDVNSKEIAGYYSISTGELEFESLPDPYKKRLPRYYPIPIVRIGRLAVTQSMKGRGLGKQLLFHALYKAVDFSREIGIFAVTVDAIDENAKNFYLKYGFIALQIKSMSLFIPIQKLAKEFE